jgi:hypothetical protein
MSEEMNQEQEREKESYLSDAEVITYCKKYLETWNKTEAYLAVHPESTRESAISNAPRYYNNPKVREVLAFLLQDKVMSIDEIVSRIAERARDSSNKQAQLKALELIGKTKGIFLDRTDITTAGQKVSWNQFINSEGEVVKDSRGTSVIMEE